MENNLFKLLRTICILVFITFSVNSFNVLSGTKTISGNYGLISAAVTDLNAQSFGTGGVTFNFAAGYTESIMAPIIITATGTSDNVIIF